MNRPSCRALAPLLLAVLAAVAVRAPGLNRSLGHDEAFALEAFASQPYGRIATSYAAPFQLYSTERFAIDRPGLLLLVYAKTYMESYASVYRVDDTRAVTRPHMHRTATWPAVSRGRDEDTWNLDAYLLPVDRGGQYGVYILGGEASHQRFADLACYFFPYPD